MADTPPLPPLGDLLRDAPLCLCRPGQAEFVSVPGSGTHLVKDGQAALVPDAAPDVPIGDVISETVRRMYEYAARVMADAPPGTELEIKIMTDGMAEARLLGTYVFTRTAEGVDRG